MKISIVIPTRNRSEFLRYCVQTCLACNDDNIEIIVSDNNSADDTRQCIEAIGDPRLKYICTGQDLSMRQNFEFALDHATGDYIIYIGDDDGVLPNGLVALRRLIDRYRPDVILWRHITYDWPRGEDGAIPGRLKFRCRDFCGPMKFIDPMTIFKAFCQAERTNYRNGANIYHGCVHRRVIDQVRSRQNGVYFNDISPDINTSLTNLTASRSIAWFRNPVTIAGAGEKSTGYAFTPHASTSGVQKEVTKDHASLVVEDKIQPRLDVNFRSIIAHAYANLCAVHSALNNPDIRVNHDAWRQAIIADTRAFRPELRQWDTLEAFFKRTDPAYQHAGLAASDPEAVNPPRTTEHAVPQPGKPAKPKAGRVPATALRNVETVMRWIQAVTGRPYTPSPNPAFALVKQAYRSAGIQLRIKSTSKKARSE
ncbi:MAG: glycosyltransferase [Phycisphaeraceae bacterium]|nr:glycosyltransferase [Phycisphaeraceae bacterium]